MTTRLDMWDGGARRTGLLTQIRRADPFQRSRARRRILVTADPLARDGLDAVAYARQLLHEYTAAHDSARRCKTYAGKPTTSGREHGAQVELHNTHLVRQERVVMLVAEAFRTSALFSH
jgi:hypothetical protein